MTTSMYHRTYVRYADVLEAFISKYKSRPPDIKFWPYGPYWPADSHGPVTETPRHIRITPLLPEMLYSRKLDQDKSRRTVDNQETVYTNRWRGVQIVYDSERSSKDYQAPPVTEGNCPCLTFESRFECGNLRQARRIGQFEYELVLKTDLYTKRHTQWYYFRVHNAIPGITYKFKIVNLLKKNSLYNYGMRPLSYSEENAASRGIGWVRSGHHISYSRNTTNLHCPLLHREMAYFMLEWQMEFPHADDTCYLAHCYPYSYTDLKDDLEALIGDPERAKVINREVMCETRAGNSCFLVTVTNFESSSNNKKGVVVSARVHPGESQSSWMMKGLLDFITSSKHTAKELRNKFIFKIVPMLNPDGVIVGNYRCSLAGRDLNRNYRHPRRESFPTIWHMKNMMEEFGRSHEIMVYCDLHGHSRKSNVFMYGCNTTSQSTGAVSMEAFLNERLFPWLMAQKAPERFSFNGCKFQIKKCKESTGRVVMFRQLQIQNSFTMEATFSGSTICKGDKRHFNLKDFEEMGKVFGEVAVEYEKIQDNKALQSEVVIDLTRAITHQILQARGMLPTNLPNFTPESSTTTGASQESVKMSSSKQVTAAICEMVTKETAQTKSQTKNEPNRWTREPVPKAMNEDQIKQKAKDLTKMDVNNLLDNMSGKTIDGCIRLLEQLNIKEMCLESDSSDSDSESEPEMKYKESSKKKKKKKKKSKEGDRKLKGKDASTPDRNKCSGTLPAIGLNGTTEGNKKQMTIIALGKKPAKTYPSYINKYEGRSNGGIPCFSEERSMERAAKKMTEMQKRMEDEKQRQQTIYYQATEGNGNNPMLGYPNNWSLNHSRSYTDLRQQVADAVQSKGSANVRTGYMHADGSSPELIPGIQPMQPTVNQHLSYAEMQNFSSSESEDDDEIEFVGDIPKPMPLPALNSPYQNVASHMTGALQPFMQAVVPRSIKPQPGGRYSQSTISPIAGASKPLVVSPSMNMSSHRKAASADQPGYKAQSVPTMRPVHRVQSLPLHQRNDVEITDPHYPTREYTEFITDRLKKHRNSQPSLPINESMTIRLEGHRHSTTE